MTHEHQEALILLAIAAGVGVVLIWIGVLAYRADRECTARGGALVRDAVYGYRCVALQEPKR